MKAIEYRIEGLTIAITNMDQMLDFYSNVFGVRFEPKDMYGSKLYSGKWGDFSLLFCPAEIARNEAKQNRHQFEIVVADLDGFIQSVKKYDGETMGDQITEGHESRSIGIYDPDKNSIVIRQLKT